MAESTLSVGDFGGPVGDANDDEDTVAEGALVVIFNGTLADDGSG